MDAVLEQVKVVAREMWRRRWIGLGVAWLAGAVGAVFVALVPDRYEATARVFVDTESVLKPLMAGLAVQPDINQQLSILSRTLISRPNVEKLIRMADLDMRANSSAEREALIEQVTRTLSMQGSGRDNLYSIAYRHTEPEKARKVVQSLLTIFVESSLGDKKKDTASARKFLDEQIAQYAEKLDEAENRLKEFKLRNVALGVGGSQDSLSKLTQAQAELETARLQLRAAQDSRDSLKRQLADEDPVLAPPQAGNSAPTQVAGEPPNLRMMELDKRYDGQRTLLNDLLGRFTDAHPDVINARRVLADLERDREREIAAIKAAKAAVTPPVNAAGKPVVMSTNPVFQKIKIALSEAEANVASLQGRTAELEARYNQARVASRALPQLEAELVQLNRDYEVQRKNYESLVSRRESAALSGEMDASANVADFRVIDPPRVSSKPVAPNRMFLLAGAFLAALGAGLAASFAASQVFPTFHDARTLRTITERPVLGSISMLKTEGVITGARRRLVAFLGAFGALLGAYGAAFAFLVLHAARPV